MKPGDLIRYYDYINCVAHVGLLIKCVPLNRQTNQWHDIIVLCGGKEVGWVSWQCEVMK